MKTLSLELTDPKEVRRLAYGGGRFQDHGTRGTQRDKDWYDRTAAQIRETDLANTALTETIDYALAQMSPHELELTANRLLSDAGYGEDWIDNEDEWRPWALQKDADAMLFDDDSDGSAYDPDSTNTYRDHMNTLRSEITGIRHARRMQMANAERVYEGRLSPDDDAGDFVDGFIIRDRP